MREKPNVLKQIATWGQEKLTKGQVGLKTAQQMEPAISDKRLTANELPNRFSHERLTVNEVAERLRVHPWTIYNWARSRRLPCIRLSKRTLRFLESDIAKYEKQHTSSPIR